MDSSARLHAANGLALQLAARASAFRHGLQLARIVPAEADASQALPVDRHVQAASEALWEDITSLHSGLLRTDAPLASEVNPHRRLLEAKIAQFQAELDTIRSTDVGPTGQSKETTRELVLEELRDSIDQLGRGLKLAATDVERLKERRATEQEFAAQHRQVSEALQRKADVLEEEAASPSDTRDRSQSAKSEELRRNIKHVSDDNRRLLTTMLKFLTKYFPRPEGTHAATHIPKRSRTDRAISDYMANKSAKLHTLSKFLEDLMNSCITKPHDPYIRITEQHWPPYVELLVRSGIALVHPSDPTRLKLTEFHT